MAVTVEIKTDKRSVIEYFLTPMLQHTSESLRERWVIYVTRLSSV
jgi:hemolysin D